jgi:hypothetical protein
MVGAGGNMEDTSGLNAESGGENAREVGPSRSEIRRLVAHAILAPSGGNIQAWRFEGLPDGRLRCFYDGRRAENFLDFEQSASYLALGMAVENIVLSAATLGLTTHIELLAPDGSERVCDLRFTRQTPSDVPAELANQIERRCTNRRLGNPRERIAPASLERVRDAAERHGAHLQLVSDKTSLAEIGAVVGVCDRLRLCNELMHREMMAEVRWTTEEAARTGDGVDVQTLEVNGAQIWLLKRLASYRNVRGLMRLGVEGPFEQMGAESVRRSSAVGLLTLPGTSSSDYFRGGRALSSVWLTTTALELGFQPLAVVPYMFARLVRGSGYTPDQERLLRGQRQRLGKVLQLRDDAAEVMLFRLSNVRPPSVRSQRRPLAAVLTFPAA